jgi:hypothetical protein
MRERLVSRRTATPEQMRLIGRRRKPPVTTEEPSGNADHSHPSPEGYLTVRVRIQEPSPKTFSELALYAIGQYLHESESLSLEDYLKLWELLRILQGTALDVSRIANQDRRDLAVTIEMILRYSEKSFSSNQAEVLPKSRIWEAIGFKTQLQQHLSSRAHGSRSSTWKYRYQTMLQLLTVETDPINDERIGIRYSSWSRGHPAGSTLRQQDPNAGITEYLEPSSRQHGPTSEIWDPAEFRARL